ncbi:hypothetical protein BK010_03415 [Tenericutes bacterium MO-XQ]|nr:hypothetical protein BK010_03415 [Tenericutes bacterium MO-XQ]
MDNYKVAINGTKLAAQILGIDTPDVQFFYNKDLTGKGINSIFLKEDYIIAFNEEWVEQANPMEIQVTCFHESRHAFQWKCINEDGPSNVELSTLQIWKKEMNEYSQPTKKDIPEEEYLMQEIEIDAIAFAHKMMLEHFGLKTGIPNIIEKEIQQILMKDVISDEQKDL